LTFSWDGTSASLRRRSSLLVCGGWYLRTGVSTKR